MTSGCRYRHSFGYFESSRCSFGHRPLQNNSSDYRRTRHTAAVGLYGRIRSPSGAECFAVIIVSEVMPSIALPLEVTHHPVWWYRIGCLRSADASRWINKRQRCERITSLQALYGLLRNRKGTQGCVSRRRANTYVVLCFSYYYLPPPICMTFPISLSFVLCNITTSAVIFWREYLNCDTTDFSSGRSTDGTSFVFTTFFHLKKKEEEEKISME